MHKFSLTIIMVAYKPKSDLLKSLILQFNSLYSIIIVNNTQKKLENFFYKFQNVEIIDTKNNLGNGAGINKCLDHCTTNFALYLDTDVKISNESLNKLLEYSNKIKDFGVLVPNGDNGNTENDLVKKWDMEGSIMLINKKKINDKIKFDENYFLYYEETDFFFNCLKKNINVYFLPKVLFLHNRQSSIDVSNNLEKSKIELLRQWHFMWSKFYFYKKNFGFLKSLKVCFPFFLKDLIFLILNLISFNKEKTNLRLSRISGLIHSFLGFKSSKRP
tara:strand:- start:96 stop:917 length:822 start_codon:yes stop_codon:yes gene_type:complete